MMTAPISIQDLIATGPLTIVAAFSLVVFLVESLRTGTEGLTFWISLVGLLSALWSALQSIGSSGTAYAGMVTTGGYAGYFAVVFCTAGTLSILLSKSYIEKTGMEHGEYYGILLLALLGMMLMAAAADLIIFFLGLELMSICFYVLAGFLRKRAVSNEAALKYFLLGAFATGFLLYGIALVYGTTGSTRLTAVAAKLPMLATSPLLQIGLGLLLVGLLFKVAAVPFHMWVPDVYEGAPTTVSAFMSTAGKAAAFSIILLVFTPKVVVSIGPLRDILALAATLSMIVGNVMAVSQTSVKRMLAYSSIAHAGYILVGVVAGNATGSNGVLFYVMAYTMMNVGAFGVLSIIESADGKLLGFDDYAGLATRQPMMAGLMALFMFALSGIPPFAGFFGKYYVFAGAVQSGYTWLAIVGVLMSVVSAYYYLRLVVLMYFKEQVSTIAPAVPAMGLMALLLSALGLIGLGVFPSIILNLIAHFF